MRANGCFPDEIQTKTKSRRNQNGAQFTKSIWGSSWRTAAENLNWDCLIKIRRLRFELKFEIELVRHYPMNNHPTSLVYKTQRSHNGKEWNLINELSTTPGALFRWDKLGDHKRPQETLWWWTSPSGESSSECPEIEWRTLKIWTDNRMITDDRRPIMHVQPWTFYVRLRS